MKKALLILNLVTIIFYMNFTCVRGYGGPGEEFVFKAFHGLKPIYGGGEEKVFEELKNSENPWYVNPAQYKRIYSSNTETNTPLWLTVFLLGYLFMIILTLTNILVVIKKRKQLTNRLT